MTVPQCTFLLAAVLLNAPVAEAQIVGGAWETLEKFRGQAVGDRLGISVSGCGDLDGDGFDDVVVGAPFASPNGLVEAGSAFVRSGATGILIHRLDGVGTHDQLGSSIASIADVDGDGVGDLLVGARLASIPNVPFAGSAFVYSGSTGAIIRRHDGQVGYESFGCSVSGVEDLDGDGVGDYLVGASRAMQGFGMRAGAVLIYSGLSGNLVRRIDGQVNSDSFGTCVSSVSDVDGDGINDLIVGASTASPGGVGATGAAYLYSGATGSFIRRFDGQVSGGSFGSSVTGIGDADGDGICDLLLGEPYASHGGQAQSGSAHLVSGATGSLVLRIDGQTAGDQLGTCVANAGDVDGDGMDDFAIGASGASPGGLHRAGSAYVYSGATGDLISQTDGRQPDEWLGYSLATAGNADSSGLSGVVVGGPGLPGITGTVSAGTAVVCSLDPFLHTSAGSISASGSTNLLLEIGFPRTEAGARFAVLASLAGTGPTNLVGLDIPLAQDGLFSLCASGNAPAPLVGAYGTLNHDAEAFATLQVGTALTPVVGRTVYFAAVTFDAVSASGRVSSIVRHVKVVP